MDHPLRNAPAVVRNRAFARTPRRAPLAWRLLEQGADAPKGEQARDRPLALLEAALMLADEPLSARRLATLAGLTDVPGVKRHLARLRDLYEADGSAFVVEEIAGGYQLLTRPEFHMWLARLERNAPETQLTAAGREALAIVAYRQPVTRADIEAIRGVGSSEVLERLMEKGLIKLAGRDDSLGRPALYETTKKFLQMLGLKSLRDLPPAEGVAGPRVKSAE